MRAIRQQRQQRQQRHQPHQPVRPTRAARPTRPLVLALAGPAVLLAGTAVPLGLSGPAAGAEVDPGAPSVTLGAPDGLAEGQDATLTAVATDPQDDPLTYAWSVTLLQGGPTGAVVLPDGPTSDPDDPQDTALLAAVDGWALVSVSVEVSDGEHTTTASRTVTVENRDPWIETPSGLRRTAAPGEVVSFSTDRNDVPGDTLTCTFWADGASQGVDAPGCTATYAAPLVPGTYRDRIVVTDEDGGQAEVFWWLDVTGPAPDPDPEPTYPWSGFEGPVDDLPVVNTVTAGAAVPVQFSLGGDRGLGVLAEGSPASQRHTCDGGDPVDAIESTVSTGQTGLRYDATTDRYTYVWKTARTWRGQCRTLVLGLDDGSTHVAEFRFR